MLRAFAIQAVALAIGFLVVDAIMDSVTVDGGFFTALGIAVIYGLISGVLGTILRLLALPLLVLTLGLFAFVINAALLLLTEWITDSLEIDGFLNAILAAALLAIVAAVAGVFVGAVVPGDRRD